MDIEVKRMSPTAIEMLDQLSAVCKRFGVDYYAASQNQRDLFSSYLYLAFRSSLKTGNQT